MHSHKGVEYFPDTPVEISQYKKEFASLLLLYMILIPNRVLEIGTHYGGTLYNWMKNGEPDSTIVAVDDYHLNESLYEEWKKPDQTIHRILGKSQNETVVSQVRELGPYDFIFIDGAHDYESVKEDWKNYKSMLTEEKKMKVVAFHDILSHPNSEVSELWKEINEYGYTTMELTSDKNQEGCGIGVVFL